MSHSCSVVISADNQPGAGLPARAAAVAVNGSLLENTSGASDEGVTLASSIII
ncbi:MAG: hypothetical protein Q8S18_12450 [Bacteroidales bacterium]|nr:hypothetical protein [Bacteroidales bacterium]